MLQLLRWLGWQCLLGCMALVSWLSANLQKLDWTPRDTKLGLHIWHTLGSTLRCLHRPRRCWKVPRAPFVVSENWRYMVDVGSSTFRWAWSNSQEGWCESYIPFADYNRWGTLDHEEVSYRCDIQDWTSKAHKRLKWASLGCPWTRAPWARLETWRKKPWPNLLDLAYQLGGLGRKPELRIKKNKQRTQYQSTKNVKNTSQTHISHTNHSQLRVVKMYPPPFATRIPPRSPRPVAPLGLWLPPWPAGPRRRWRWRAGRVHRSGRCWRPPPQSRRPPEIDVKHLEVMKSLVMLGWIYFGDFLCFCSFFGTRWKCLGENVWGFKVSKERWRFDDFGV